MQLLSLKVKNIGGKYMIELGKKQTLTDCEVRRVWRISCRRYECRYKASGTACRQSRFRRGPKLVINWKFLFIKILRIE